MISAAMTLGSGRFSSPARAFAMANLKQRVDLNEALKLHHVIFDKEIYGDRVA